MDYRYQYSQQPPPVGRYPPPTSAPGYPPNAYALPNMPPQMVPRPYPQPQQVQNHPMVVIPQRSSQFNQQNQQQNANRHPQYMQPQAPVPRPQPPQKPQHPQAQPYPKVVIPKPPPSTPATPSMSTPATAATTDAAEPVSYQLLLLSLAEEYIAAAHGMCSTTALAQRPKDLGKYYKLMATGLGCMESVLKV